MKLTTSIKIKAALLLVVFSLNTVVSTACAMGLNLDFNSSHHVLEATESAIHIHAGGEKHDHEMDEANKASGSTAFHYDNYTASQKDNCCTEELMQFQQLAKNLSAKTSIDMPVFVAIISTFLGIDIFKSVRVPSKKYSVQYFHPPQPDIRIAIQSFQI